MHVLFRRHVYILDYELNVLSQLVIPPKYGEISGLLWLSRTAVLATSAEALLVWRHFDSDTKPALILGQAMGLTIASASWKTLTLAAASRDGVVSFYDLFHTIGFFLLLFASFTTIPEEIDMPRLILDRS